MIRPLIADWYTAQTHAFILSYSSTLTNVDKAVTSRYLTPQLHRKNPLIQFFTSSIISRNPIPWFLLLLQFSRTLNVQIHCPESLSGKCVWYLTRSATFPTALWTGTQTPEQIGILRISIPRLVGQKVLVLCSSSEYCFPGPMAFVFCVLLVQSLHPLRAIWLQNSVQLCFLLF